MKRLLLLFSFFIFIPSCVKDENDVNFIFDTQILDTLKVWSIAFDNSGNTWIGTYKQGLIKYNSTETIVYNSSNSLFSDTTIIYDIAVDSKNNIWIGCEGLVKFDGTTFTLFDNTNSPIPKNHVTIIDVDSKDNIWLASSSYQSGGLVKFDGTSWTVYTPDNSDIPLNLINGLTIDKSDNLWLAQSEKVNNPYLSKLSNDQWTVYSKADFGITPYYFGDVQINSKDKACVAIDHLYGGGYIPQVFIYDGNSSKTLEFDNFSMIIHLRVDKDDNIWCTGSSGYLAVYDGKIWHKKHFEEGVLSIEQAPDGRMWLGTGEGIFINE